MSHIPTLFSEHALDLAAEYFVDDSPSSSLTNAESKEEFIFSFDDFIPTDTSKQDGAANCDSASGMVTERGADPHNKQGSGRRERKMQHIEGSDYRFLTLAIGDDDASMEGQGQTQVAQARHSSFAGNGEAMRSVTGGGPVLSTPAMASTLTEEELQQQRQRKQRRSELIGRTVHLRCLPPLMLQRELAVLLQECGPFTRVRICGNGTDNQNWVYGFVEFATYEAAARMFNKNGMELANGKDRPPLRLQCHKAKQPILDCLPADAGFLRPDQPCRFGNNDSAMEPLREVLLVVGPAKQTKAALKKARAAATVSDMTLTAVVADSFSNNGNRRHVSAGFSPSPPSSSRSTQEAAESGCGCGCNGANCCSCCRCHHSKDTPTEKRRKTGVDSATAAESSGERRGRCSGDGNSSSADEVNPKEAHGSGCGTKASPNISTTASLKPTDSVSMESTSAEAVKLPLSPESVAIELSNTLKMWMNAGAHGGNGGGFSLSGLVSGTRVVREGMALVLGALRSAMKCLLDVSSGARCLAQLAELQQLLEANAAVTGGPAATGTGDCTAVVPQQVTQLRLLASLLALVVHASQRDVSLAVPHIEAIVSCFNAIPVPRNNNSAEHKSVVSGENLSSQVLSSGTTVRAQQFMDVSPVSLVNPSLTPDHREFHRYTCNVLVAVGLATERFSWPVAKAVYALATARAEAVFGEHPSVLDRCLSAAQSSEGCYLYDVLFPSAGVRGSDVATFARLFLSSRSLDVFLQVAERGGDGDFWGSPNLPPMHAVNCFPS